MTATQKPNETSPSYLRIVDTVLNQLEDAILSGRIGPGERLIEVALAVEFGVGRTTIREAFLMLQKRGLVVSVPRRGTFVSRIEREEALDLAYSRALLESFAVVVGFPNINESVIARLEEQLAVIRICRIPDDIPQLVKIDLSFHQTLVETAEMPRLQELWSSLNGQIGALYIRGMEEQQLDVKAVVALHEKLVDALRSGDPAATQRAIISHYVRADELTSPRGKVLLKMVASGELVEQG